MQRRQDLPVLFARAQEQDLDPALDRDKIDLGYELATLPWAPRVVLTSTDADAVNEIEPRDGCPALPFVPKHELPTASLRRLLTAS